MSNSHPTSAGGRQSGDGEARPDAEIDNNNMEQRVSSSAADDNIITTETKRNTTTSNDIATSPTRFGKLSSVPCWALAVAACLWLSLCTALGPIYWQYYYNPGAATFTTFSLGNAVLFIETFAIYLAIIIELVRFARGQRLLPRWLTRWARNMVARLRHHETKAEPISQSSAAKSPRNQSLPSAPSSSQSTNATTAQVAVQNLDPEAKPPIASDNAPTAKPANANPPVRLRTRMWNRTKTLASRAAAISRSMTMHVTDKWWKIALILVIGWLWVPTTLVAAFGADIRNQFREFSWAWNQWTGLRQPYIGFFSFVPMDIYPTAHYLWPKQPIYLTDQHNIVLTLLYGGAGTVSRYFTGSNDLGLAVLAAAQFLFAAFAVAATANRFFNRPWLKGTAAKTVDVTKTGTVTQVGKTGKAKGAQELNQAEQPQRSGIAIPAPKTVDPLPRFVILLFFLLCPLVLFSTISLTKSPLFAFAFVWWFGIGYELLSTTKSSKGVNKTAQNADATKTTDHAATGTATAAKAATTTPFEHTRKRSFIALLLSTLVMMISAKYAMYIIVFEVLIALLSDHKRWKTYVVGMLLPVVIFEGGLNLAIHKGVIINGDPIESHGVQLQQIARVAVLNPNGIPQDAREKLAPIFNLDQMAEAYFQQDADPVKSSGIQAKKVSYRWRTVTKANMRNFNAAWLEIVKANPRIATDALLSKSYGYFDIQDQPYIDMTYYVLYARNPNFTDWLGDWCDGWRKQITDFVKDWSGKPILGWLIHGNAYVIATLLIGAAEVILRRWRTLATHLPLLLLMGVMITSPANNFERHMLPLVFVLGFVILTFWQESRARRAKTRGQRADIAPDITGNASKSDMDFTAAIETAGLES
ncbi:DUF6020 family protein [Bifidobacterium sp. ESL0775]|uniref:DUF6020 family protein n=1 Tax=Bifidobacterium sp. ESL0775 TaxID=2983230 RepID=UPI0023F925AC|nr:DUF6020 family protein [Bifidobacterium sp. ESL0775]WEV69664.1 DUF6020 family protein [Bifidobacterium sp. ESL0775]